LIYAKRRSDSGVSHDRHSSYPGSVRRRRRAETDRRRPSIRAAFPSPPRNDAPDSSSVDEAAIHSSTVRCSQSLALQNHPRNSRIREQPFRSSGFLYISVSHSSDTSFLWLFVRFPPDEFRRRPRGYYYRPRATARCGRAASPAGRNNNNNTARPPAIGCPGT